MIERDFDVPLIGALALREKQIQQNYRPIIAVHKWFARRPGTLFRGLLLAEFGSQPLAESYYASHSCDGVVVADPFMGGGTPLLEANRIGCDVLGFDINPMSYWVVQQEMLHLDLAAYDEAASSLRNHLERKIGHLFRTQCGYCGSNTAHVKYYLWVKNQPCPQCKKDVSLFPGFLVAGNSRHPRNVFVCGECGALTEAEDRKQPGKCSSCRRELLTEGPARRSRCACPHCGGVIQFPNAALGAPRHHLFAMEYHCPDCRSSHRGRFFKRPDPDDMAKVEEANGRWTRMRATHVPDDEIPSGDETNRLHRWGYSRYREMFNPRQLIGLELSARFISKIKDERVRNALATNLSDLLRYQNMLCRYDTMALKSLDIFSVHGFPVGLVQCESNFLGISDPQRAACVGSGGWANIIVKFRKAKAYCDEPFEIKHNGRRKTVVPIRGEWIGDQPNGHPQRRPRKVRLVCQDAATAKLRESSLDAVFTDPPYFGNVQYAELMDFCYVWLRRLVKDAGTAFASPSTRNAEELTVNEDMGRGFEHFTEGLSSVFQRMARALKPGSPLAFTYHHNDLSAYHAVAVAVLDAALVCSGSLPCPAEMGASIHINGTGSSIIDTVFVCRSTGRVPKKWIQDNAEGVAQLVTEDVGQLELAGVRPTKGDIRCIAYGHLARLAIWALRHSWKSESQSVADRLRRVDQWMRDFGGWPAVERCLTVQAPTKRSSNHAVREAAASYGEKYAEVSF
jgi:adenine-specific DNA methylase